MSQTANQTASQTVSQTVIPIDIHTHFMPKNPGEAIIQCTEKDSFELEPGEYYSFGIHPNYCNDINTILQQDPSHTISSLRMQIKRATTLPASKFIVAIGEIGIDRELAKQQAGLLLSVLPVEMAAADDVTGIEIALSLQDSFYRLQLQIAKKNKKPVILHCVGAYDLITNGLTKKEISASHMILHGFRRKPEEAKRALKDGFYLSFGRLFNEETLKMVPDDRLFFETDADPLADIEEIYARAAQLRGTTPEALKDVVRANVSRVFGIK